MNNEQISFDKHTYLSEYIATHSNSLYDYALRLTGNADEAHDLVQDTVCRTLHNSHKYNEQNAVGSWLFTIMHNIFLNEVKSKHNKRVDDYDIERIDAPDDNDEEEVQYALDALYAAVEQLNDHDRSIITLRMQGAAYKEISEELNINEGTVKSAINRIKKHLRKKLQFLRE